MRFFLLLFLLDVGVFFLSSAFHWELWGGIFLLFFNIGVMGVVGIVPFSLTHYVNGKILSCSSHPGDVMSLQTISRRYGLSLPTFWIYESKQINAYMVKGFWGNGALAVSSECFISLTSEERSILYEYHMIRNTFPLALFAESAVSALLFSLFSFLDIFFWPCNVFCKRVFGIQKNNVQYFLNLLCLPPLSFFKAIVLGWDDHSYLNSFLASSVDRGCLRSLSFKARRSLDEKTIEYDFFACNSFMALENDLLSILTGSRECNSDLSSKYSLGEVDG